jgi:FtsP/CotA-like multicopper oxidase with cupredoxin domain
MRAFHSIPLHGWLLRGAAFTLVSLLAFDAGAAAPGISSATGSFSLNAEAARISQPDGASIYAWGYGCAAGSTVNFVPASVGTTAGANCPTMQIPGPTLVVNQGDTVTVTLTNNLPAAAGNTSILFPGFKVKATGGAPGVLTTEAAHGGTVTYSFVATTPGTHSYYSGTRGNVQIEMGLYGALIVLPSKTTTSGGTTTYAPLNGAVPSDGANSGSRLPSACIPLGSKPARVSADGDYRLAAAAYDNSFSCYDREYLFQFAEIDPAIHTQVEQQATSPAGLACTQAIGCMTIATEPYHPAYYLINGRSMPDDMDPSQYPHQPYNGNPHMHPGELTLLRIIGQGRQQHPLHEHANHLRLLARDGNLLVTATGKPAGPLLFTTSTTPGQTLDGIFQWTGKGLSWDSYAHNSDTSDGSPEGGGGAICTPDANGYYTADTTAPNYYEWCADHKVALELHPFGTVASGGPATLPDPNILTNGAWYSGSPYLGPDANARSMGTTPIPPSGTIANSPSGEAGFAYMWHSHNEREITTNNIFPGGMMMMMLVDPWVYSINEAN